MGVVRVSYFLVVGGETPGRETGFVADLPPGRVIVGELLDKATAKDPTLTRRELVVFDSLESLEKYRQAHASGNPESAPQVGIF